MALSISFAHLCLVRFDEWNLEFLFLDRRQNERFKSWSKKKKQNLYYFFLPLGGQPKTPNSSSFINCTLTKNSFYFRNRQLEFCCCRASGISACKNFQRKLLLHKRNFIGQTGLSDWHSIKLLFKNCAFIKVFTVGVLWLCNERTQFTFNKSRNVGTFLFFIIKGWVSCWILDSLTNLRMS